jgi:ParB family chromosome partitioning protein
VADFRKTKISPERAAAVEAVSAKVVPTTSGLGQDVLLGGIQATSEYSAQISRSAQNILYLVGHVYEVPLSRIQSNPLNPRSIYTTNAVDAMAQALGTHGQRISATGYIDENGDVVLIEGETRLRGARAAKLKYLRIEIKKRPATDRALYEEARASNVERREQTPLDDAVIWTELLKKGVYESQLDLARALGLSEGLVSRTLSLTSLSPKILHAITDEPALLVLRMLSSVREFLAVCGEDATLELIFEITREGLGYRDVDARRKGAERGVLTRVRPAREIVFYKGLPGALRLSTETGRLELVMKGLTAEATNELAGRLKALLQEQ